MQQSDQYWQLTLVSETSTVPFEAGLETWLDVKALSTHKNKQDQTILQAWFEDQPDRAIIDMLVARAFLPSQKIQLEIELMENKDWLAQNRKNFPALCVGRFWIYGSHITKIPPKGLYPLLIEAAQAFGSGTHPTTKGCLMALSDLTRLKNKPQQILDMGCGSAILAIAATRIFPFAKVTAADNDHISVRTAIENRGKNAVSPLAMKAVHSAGFSSRAVCRSGPYDLIMANILARPLRLMASDIAGHLNKGGRVVLSGLLTEQKQWVMQAYRAHHLCLERQIDIEEWSTLILRQHRTVRPSRPYIYYRSLSS